jgi:hypothetical protein
VRAASALVLAATVSFGGIEAFNYRAPTSGIVGSSGKASPAKKAERKRQKKARRKNR